MHVLVHTTAYMSEDVEYMYIYVGVSGGGTCYIEGSGVGVSEAEYTGDVHRS